VNLIFLAFFGMMAMVSLPRILPIAVNSITCFLDIVNDVGLEQFVTSPTRQENILELVFSTCSNISDLQIIPGMSNHEVVVF